MMKRNGKQENRKGMEDSERKGERKKDRGTERLGNSVYYLSYNRWIGGRFFVRVINWPLYRRPYLLRCLSNLQPNRQGRPFQRVQQKRLQATTHLHLVLRLRMRGAIPPVTHTSSWCGA